MSHPRIEEVSESDVSDPSEDDIDDFAEADIVRRVGSGRTTKNSQTTTTAAGRTVAQQPNQRQPQNVPSPAAVAASAATHAQAPNPAAYASYQCLYPVYFDATRTRAEGRRVSRSLAVANPLAAEIAAACQKLRLAPVLEATKLHPKDWANPGRVRVLLKESSAQGSASKGGQQQQMRPGAGAAQIRNKHHLYVLVAKHLQENPTTEKSPALWMRLPGVPLPDPAKPYPRPAVPRGWKMGELLPYYSPALTGGGVSENLFKDMMKEMQGGGDMSGLLSGAGGGEGGSSGDKKKDKKGKGKGKS